MLLFGAPLRLVLVTLLAGNGLTRASHSPSRRDGLDLSDPRVGSARDNGTTSTVLRVPGGTNSPSGLSLLMTMLPIWVFAVVCMALFLLLRTRYPRVYAPRTFLKSLPAHERSEPLPSGWFDWAPAFWHVPDKYVLDHCSLDAFLFLRYIKVVCIICLVGCCITWPVLFPIHITGGGTNTQLDLLTFGNVASPKRFYAHAILAWIFFSFILYMVSRECIYYIHLRQAYLLSPLYAERLSSRTVLFTCIPAQDLDEHKLRKLFGDTVRSVWIPRDTQDLERLVQEKEDTANRLQRAEVLLVKKADLARKRVIKSGRGHPDLETGIHTPAAVEKGDPMASKTTDTETTIQSVASSSSNDYPFPNSPTLHSPPAILEEATSPYGPPGMMRSDYSYEPPPNINGSVAAQWIPHESRPTHRPLANYLRKVDTIKWARTRIEDLTPTIEKLKRSHRAGRGDPIPAAFIEFVSQADAQGAYQTLCHHRAFHMASEIVGVNPDEIVWKSLRMKWYERIIRKFLVQALVAVMVIFWAIPAALVGTISNITALANSVPFLTWILSLPPVLLGLISGLLPAVALSLLMSMVPGMMRACARMAGMPTLSQIELYCQNAYFIFQVVQVFLVTTITSAASAAITGILQSPMTAPDLLSANIPKASNFYVSYFILQGLAMSASNMVHLFSLFRDQWFLYSNGNPRVMTKRWFRLRRLHWGAIYPVFTNMGVIAITYSLIAPLVMGFAILGLYPIYLSYKYNLLYVYASPTSSQRTHAFEPVHTPSTWRTRTFVSPDAQGLHYPRALKQTLTGLYLAEICLFGLFILKGAFGPLVMIVALIVVTALVQISLNAALGPLMYTLPRTLALAEAARRAGKVTGLEDTTIPDAHVSSAPKLELDFGDNPAYFNMDTEPSHDNPPDVSGGFGDNPVYYEDDELPDLHGESQPRPPVTNEETTRGIDTGIEGLPAATELITTSIHELMLRKIQAQTSKLSPYVARANFWTPWISPVREEGVKPNFVLKWLHPEVFEDYEVLREGVPDLPVTEETARALLPEEDEEKTAADLPAPPVLIGDKSLPTDIIESAETFVRFDGSTKLRKRKVKVLTPGVSFEPPCMVSTKPRLWIPRDEGHVSTQEVRHCSRKGALEASDEGIWLTEKSMIAIDFDVIYERALGVEHD